VLGVGGGGECVGGAADFGAQGEEGEIADLLGGGGGGVEVEDAVVCLWGVSLRLWMVGGQGFGRKLG
jgi:hypothetical protein